MKLPEWADDSKRFKSNKVVKNAIITVASGLVRFLSSFITAIVLGRLLSPEDFGLAGMITPLIMLASVLSDGGASAYILKSERVDSNRVNLTFWIAAFFGAILYSILFLLSPLVAFIYEDQRLVEIIIVASISIVFSVLASQPNALVKRFYKQEYYAVAEIVAGLASVSFAVIFALSGAGYWSLVTIPVVRQFTHMLVIWYKVKWMPGSPSIIRNNYSEAKIIIGFGGSMILAQLLGVLGKNIDKIFLGLYQSAEDLGFYMMAFNIMMLPSLQILTPIGSSVIPYFSQEMRKSSEQLSKAICNVMFVVLVLICPFVLWISIKANEIIVFVLGSKWIPSAEILSILSVASIFMAVCSVFGWVYVSISKPFVTAKINLFSLVFLSFFCFIFGRDGGVIVAYVVLANYVFLSLLFFYLIVLEFGTEFRVLFTKVILKVLFAAMFSILVLWIRNFSDIFMGFSVLFEISFDLCVCVFVFYVVIFGSLSSSERSRLKEMFLSKVSP